MVGVKQIDQFVRQKEGGVSFCMEVPIGVVDGSNVQFTLSGTPQTILLFCNGLFMKPGTSDDYTISGNIITFNYPPEVNSVLFAVWG